MTITRDQVADLQPGDVVEMSWSAAGGQVTIRGPLVAGSRRLLAVAGYWVREADGSPIQALDAGGSRTLTVISRAPCPLYVNHPRNEPVPGDVVRDANGNDAETWYYVRLDFGSPWGTTTGPRRFPREGLPARLRLLVDGKTGQVVP